MKQFYKTQIKLVAETLKFAKPASRKLRSLWDRGLTESEEYKSLYPQVPGNIPALQRRARLLNLAYALVRGKDISKVETNPKVPVEMKEIENFMAKMELEFQATQKEAVVAHE